MAIVGTTALTYADWAKRMDDGYKVAAIIELLSQTNELLDDMMVVEGNLPTGHKTTVRTALPQATWRLLNTGVPNAKSTTAQLVEACGNLETTATNSPTQSASPALPHATPPKPSRTLTPPITSSMAAALPPPTPQSG